jgi:DNA polymerase III alpha subunit
MVTEFISLGNHRLWFDGIIEVDPSSIDDMILSGVDPSRLASTSITPELSKFNRMSRVKINTKDHASDLKYDWIIPDEFKKLNINNYVIEVLAARVENDELFEARLSRIQTELELFEKHNLTDVLRTLIYVVDTFKKNNVVWGVGRGSSCSSYLLFLIGIHSVDPVKYDIQITDFLR